MRFDNDEELSINKCLNPNFLLQYKRLYVKTSVPILDCRCTEEEEPINVVNTSMNTKF